MASVARSDAWLSAWVFRELCRYPVMSSWDWEADHRLCQALKDVELTELAEDLLRSRAPWSLQISVRMHAGLEEIRVRRLRGLQELVRLDLVEARWLGTGEGGRTSLGVNRIKVYTLKESY